MANITRRTFVAAAAAVPMVAQARPKRIAIVTTIYKYLSHGQHIGDRFLVGYPIDGEWHQPNVKVVSLYVDQKPEGDLSGERAKEFGFQVYPTIAEALCCGGKTLACRLHLILRVAQVAGGVSEPALQFVKIAHGGTGLRVTI